MWQIERNHLRLLWNYKWSNNVFDLLSPMCLGSCEMTIYRIAFTSCRPRRSAHKKAPSRTCAWTTAATRDRRCDSWSAHTCCVAWPCAAWARRTVNVNTSPWATRRERSRYYSCRLSCARLTRARESWHSPYVHVSIRSTVTSCNTLGVNYIEVIFFSKGKLTLTVYPCCLCSFKYNFLVQVILWGFVAADLKNFYPDVW